MKLRAAFIGAGKLGSAIGGLIRENAASVEFWDKNPALVPDQRPLERVAAEADVLFFCVPSWALPEAFASAAPHVRRAATVVCVSKGIEKRSGLTVDALFARAFPSGPRFVFLGGAMLAAELAAGTGGAGAAATKSAAAWKTLSALFAGTRCKLERSADVRGAVMCGILKNVYALGLGMADGLGWGNNLKGWLAASALREMAGMLPLLGGRASTAYSSAGAGDLLATGFSGHSTHRKAGCDLAATGKIDNVCEGMLAIAPLQKRLGRRAKKFPLFRAIKEIVLLKKPPKSLFDHL